jgi:LmbE family N-acetylglucosaminyl deacetylase
MLRLLCITAHPDDEAGAFGGSLLLAHERGVETFVVCLTPGQAGTHRGGTSSDEELAALRRQEFQASCDHLHVTEGVVLDYPDSKLDRQNLFEVAGELARWVRQLRPQVLLTFGPEGGVTAHPDHSMASLFATAAFQWAARSNRYGEQFYEGLKPHQAQKLYYATADFRMEGRQPVSLAPTTTVIDISRHFERKIEAFRKHTSQEPLFGLFENNIRPQGPRELFHLAAVNTPREINALETDLWQGIEEEVATRS